MWFKLEKGEDGAGVRYFLDGRPIRTGSTLFLRLPSSNERHWLAKKLEELAGARAIDPNETRALQRAADLLRAPVAQVRFEVARGEPRFCLLTGTDPYIYSAGVFELERAEPGAYGARWDGAVLQGLGSGWRTFEFCWPREHPEGGR